MKCRMILAFVILVMSSLVFSAPITVKELNDIADKINKQLPTMVDKVTKFTKVTVYATTFRYHYIITNISASAIDANKFNEAMRKNLMTAVCDDKFARMLFDNAYSISFDYADKDDAQITSILFKPSDCPKEEPKPSKKK